MDINRLNEIVAESMNKVLNEALEIKCQGNNDWKNATRDISEFITLVNNFHEQFMGMKREMARDSRGSDFSASIKELCSIIRCANGKIYKQNGKNDFEQRSSLKGKYAEPIDAMYVAKSGMVTSLLKTITSNRVQFKYIESVLECDEAGKRAINVYYGRKKIGSYHMPESIEALSGLYTKRDNKNWKDRDEDFIRSDGKPTKDIEAWKKALERNKSQITEDYLTPLETLKQWVGTEFENTEKRQQSADIKKRQEEADRGITKGYIIPVFKNDRTKPCLIKNGKNKYNIIPNALANTKKDLILKDNKGEAIWIDREKIVEKEDCIEIYAEPFFCGVIEQSGLKENFLESIRKIIKNILNEHYYGLQKGKDTRNRRRTILW